MKYVLNDYYNDYIRTEELEIKSRAFYYLQLEGKIERNKNRNKYLVLTKNSLPGIIFKSYAGT